MNDQIKPENPPAFPNKDELGNMIPGMTLRDYFAAKAMQAQQQCADARTFGGRKNTNQTFEQWRAEVLMVDAEYAYAMADYMILERSKIK